MNKSDHNKKKIAFIFPVASDARAQKRVSVFQSLGACPRVLAFEREIFTGKPWPAGYISLGRIEHKNYHKRLLPFFKSFFTIRRAVRRQDAVYVFGQDILLLVWAATRFLGNPPPFACEVADIEEKLMGGDISSRLFRLVERFAIRKSALLVATSHAYIDEYYRKRQKIGRIRHRILENKVDPSLKANPSSDSARRFGDKICIGYFGVLRCAVSWEILKRAAATGRVTVYLRGPLVIPGGADEDVSSIPNVIYGGTYVAPDELPEMYGGVDIVWVAGCISEAHSMWSRTNRFYEACFFKKPMIVQSGTQDGKIAVSHGIGLDVDLNNADEAISEISGLDENRLARWRGNMERIPKSVYTYIDEHQKILDDLCK